MEITDGSRLVELQCKTMTEGMVCFPRIFKKASLEDFSGGRKSFCDSKNLSTLLRRDGTTSSDRLIIRAPDAPENSTKNVSSFFSKDSPVPAAARALMPFRNFSRDLVCKIQRLQRLLEPLCLRVLHHIRQIVLINSLFKFFKVTGSLFKMFACFLRLVQCQASVAR